MFSRRPPWAMRVRTWRSCPHRAPLPVRMHNPPFSRCGEPKLVRRPLTRSLPCCCTRTRGHRRRHGRHGSRRAKLWPSLPLPMLQAPSCSTACTTTSTAISMSFGTHSWTLTITEGHCHWAATVAATCCRGRAATGRLAPS
jgi:hypothetical protein